MKRRPWKLEKQPPRPSLKQTRKCLRDQIQMVAFIFREIDNVVRSPYAIRTIACLRRALKWLPKK